MICGVQNLYYYVSDMKRSEVFYSEVLGFSKMFGDEYWTQFDCFGLSLALHQTDTKIPQAPEGEDHRHAGGAVLTLKVENLEETVEALRQKGAKIGPIRDEPWGKLADLEDPDGNLLNLMEPSY